MNARVRWIPLLAAALCGCAPALSTMQPAHVAPKGHVQAEIGTDFAVPTGTIVDTVDAAVTLIRAASNRELTENEQKRVFDAGVGLALNPPSPVQHIGVGVSVIDNLEVSLRYSVNALRLGTRYQFLTKAKHGVDLSVGAGVGYYVFSFPVGTILDIVELEDFSRWQFDFPILIGTHGKWYRVWGGPRLMFTTFSTSLTMNLPSSTGYPGEIEIASFSGTGAYYGGQVGAAFGYKYVFLGIELTLAQLFSSGDLDAFGKRSLSVDLDSFVIYPAIALMGEF